MTGIAWTDEQTKKLKALCDDGLSVNEIAKELDGVTRNAVIGKIYRLKLHRTRRAPSALKQAQPKPPVPKPKRTAAFVAPPAALPVVSPTVGAGTVTLMNLERHHCRWPMDVDFCGAAAIEGKSYCAYHARIARRSS